MPLATYYWVDYIAGLFKDKSTKIFGGFLIFFVKNNIYF